MPDQLFDYLNGLSLASWRYYESIDSTNTAALEWAMAGAADFSLVAADTQTCGRGRFDRKWITIPGSSLAFSLILRPSEAEKKLINRFTALAALSLVFVLEKQFGLQAEIKWPNDVLLDGKKMAGILVENSWQGNSLMSVVIGMGINVNIGSVPQQVPLHFPATCMEIYMGSGFDRWQLLADLLSEIIALRARIESPIFLNTWNDHLAFRNQWINMRTQDGNEWGLKLVGVRDDGALITEDDQGIQMFFQTGEISLNLAA